MVYVSQSEWDDCISSRRTRHRNGATDTGCVHGSSLQCFLFCSGVEPSFQLVQCCISVPCTQWWVGDSPVQMQLNDEHCSSSRRHSGVGGAAADSPLIACRKCGRCCLGSAVVGVYYHFECINSPLTNRHASIHEHPPRIHHKGTSIQDNIQTSDVIEVCVFVLVR